MQASSLWDKGWLKKQGDIYILRMTMPFPLKENNCFLAESDHGWIVLDTGVNLLQNQTVFTAALDALGISFKQLSAVYLSHYHHDHSGLAGWLQQKTDLPVYLPEPDLITWERFIDTSSYFEQAWIACQKAGWPRSFTQELAENIDEINKMLTPLPQFTQLPVGETLRLGSSTYEAMSIPGHTDGHYVFHSPESGFLFSGDNVVGHTILHLTDWPHTYLHNPCDLHLTALENLKHLRIEAVLPGHGSVFTDLPDKIDLIKAHHQKRKAAVYHALQSPMTAYELTGILFTAHEFIHIRRLVLAETLAYLDSLVKAGLVVQNLVENHYIYTRNSEKSPVSAEI